MCIRDQKEIERRDALDQAVLDRLPLRGGDDARHEVEGEDALEAVLFAVHREGDALVHERELLQALAAVHVLAGEGLEDGDERGIVGTRQARGVEDLVEAAGGGRPVHGPQPRRTPRRVSRTRTCLLYTSPS